MAKRSEISWKKDNPNTFLSNSVQKADRAVKQAMTHPEEMAVEHAFNSISRADKAFSHAQQQDVQANSVQQNKEQLDLMKQQLNDVNGIVKEQ